MLNFLTKIRHHFVSKQANFPMQENFANSSVPPTQRMSCCNNTTLGENPNKPDLSGRVTLRPLRNSCNSPQTRLTWRSGAHDQKEWRPTVTRRTRVLGIRVRNALSPGSCKWPPNHAVLCPCLYSKADWLLSTVRCESAQLRAWPILPPPRVALFSGQSDSVWWLRHSESHAFKLLFAKLGSG